MSLAQLLDGRRDHAEILGNDRQVTEGFLHGLENGIARAGLPSTGSRGFGFGRHGPVGLEAAEVIDADHVGELRRGAQAFDPPAVVAACLRIPVIQRVAPELAVLREVVGRHAGHRVGAAVAIDPQDLRMRPGVAVERDINRHVAEKIDAVVVGISVEPGPLIEKQELDHLDIGNLCIGRDFEFA